MPYTRAHIRVNTTDEVTSFVKEMNSDGTTNKYVIENFDGSFRVNARSFFGVMYSMTEDCENMFLVNETIDGYFPLFVDKYRK